MTHPISRDKCDWTRQKLVVANGHRTYLKYRNASFNIFKESRQSDVSAPTNEPYMKCKQPVIHALVSNSSETLANQVSPDPFPSPPVTSTVLTNSLETYDRPALKSDIVTIHKPSHGLKCIRCFQKARHWFRFSFIVIPHHPTPCPSSKQFTITNSPHISSTHNTPHVASSWSTNTYASKFTPVGYVRRGVLRTWHEQWVSTPAQNKLWSIRDGVSRWPSSIRKYRREEVIVTRLRVGHTSLTHGFLLRGDPPPICPEPHVPPAVSKAFLGVNSSTPQPFIKYQTMALLEAGDTTIIQDRKSCRVRAFKRAGPYHPRAFQRAEAYSPRTFKRARAYSPRAFNRARAYCPSVVKRASAYRPRALKRARARHPRAVKRARAYRPRAVKRARAQHPRAVKRARKRRQDCSHFSRDNVIPDIPTVMLQFSTNLRQSLNRGNEHEYEYREWHKSPPNRVSRFVEVRMSNVPAEASKKEDIVHKTVPQNEFLRIPFQLYKC
uniref:Uncharacterized protein n=1 Tax=Timema poppense TaxID=170557 RepID=A0A7R9D302_TIMPO|nr:unnamed protein product [Timema poppensis]